MAVPCGNNHNFNYAQSKIMETATFKNLIQHTKTLAEIGLLIDKNLGRDDIPKRHEHLQQVLVPKLLGEVIDE